MRRKLGIVLALSLVGALAIAGIAVAEGALTLSATPTVVVYPHSAKLTLTIPSVEETEATILRLPAGASEWTTVTTEATSTWTVHPRGTTAYKASWNGMESEPVTVSVAARVVKPQIIKGRGRKGTPVVVKGEVSPGHRSGKVTVQFYRSETVRFQGKKDSAWILHSERTVDLTYRNPQLSKYSTTWRPSEAGAWKVVVIHEDEAHIKSSARAFVNIRK